MIQSLIRYTHVLSVVGDILTIKADGATNGELALVENRDGEESLAQVIRLRDDEVSLQVFSGGRGISSGASVRFLGHPMQVPVSDLALGRVFRGSGEMMDDGPSLSGERHEACWRPYCESDHTRELPSKMIHTRIPMIDLFTTAWSRVRKSRFSRSPVSPTTSCLLESASRPMPM